MELEIAKNKKLETKNVVLKAENYGLKRDRFEIDEASIDLSVRWNDGVL